MTLSDEILNLQEQSKDAILPKFTRGGLDPKLCQHGVKLSNHCEECADLGLEDE